VLLGEAFVPPIATLGPHLRSHRLKLHQLNRRAPEGAQSWDDWQAEFLGRYLINQRLQIEADKAAKEKKQAMLDQKLARKRDEALFSLDKELKRAYPDSRPGTSGSNLGRGVVVTAARHGQAKATEYSPGFQMYPPSPTPLQPNQNDEAERLRLSNGVIATPRRPERLMAPEAQPAPTGQLLGGHEVEDVLRGLPSAFRGTCCLDVELAFLGPEDPEEATTPGFDGVLALELQTLRMPPLDHGCVRVRVCEVAEATPREPERPARQDTSYEVTDSSRHLGALLSARCSQPGPPPLPTTRPLWFSSPTALGSDGSGGLPRCTADWSQQEGATASLWISSRSDVLMYCAQDLLQDSARDGIGPPKPKLRRPTNCEVEVSYEWTPVQLTARKPLPRSNERMEASALLEPAINPQEHLWEAEEAEVKELIIPCAPSGPRPTMFLRRKFNERTS